MATTTFSGPIKAGTISNTTGTTLGENITNTGQVAMTQSILIEYGSSSWNKYLRRRCNT